MIFNTTIIVGQQQGIPTTRTCSLCGRWLAAHNTFQTCGQCFRLWTKARDEAAVAAGSAGDSDKLAGDSDKPKNSDNAMAPPSPAATVIEQGAVGGR